MCWSSSSFLIKVFTIPAWLMLGFWFGLQLVNGLAMDVAGGGVAYWAHAGGFVAGVLLVLPAFLRRGGPAYWAATHGKPPHEEVEYVVARRAAAPCPPCGAYARPDRQRPLSEFSRVPRSGQRRRPTRTPWSGNAIDPVACTFPDARRIGHH
jgi:hypothetical protein